MKKTHWKYRFLIWYAHRILKVPIVVNFTPDFMDELYGVGFAWSPEAAQRMRGSDRLIERVKNAEAAAHMATGSRSARRLANRAARRAGEKELKRERS